MCNIAGYLGEKNAAPILLEMLRRQAPFDGDMSTGIATVHEGKLYYCKIVGDVDRLIRETDVLSLPGTVGIAHTRPGGNPAEPPYHPFLSPAKDMAVVTNGTTPQTRYTPLWDEAVDLLYREGYRFLHESEKTGKSPRLSHNGHYVSPAEARCFLIDYHMKRGASATRALALACSAMYSDNVTVMLRQDLPDQIHVLRTTRPMNLALIDGEAYLATARVGFPEKIKGSTPLPLFSACTVKREGVWISSDRLEGEQVSEMTPFTYAEGYRRLEALLKSEKAPFYFDQLELFVGKELRPLWEGDHTLVQHARLVYDLLDQFQREGRLKKEMRLQKRPHGVRHRWYFWL